LLVEDFNTGQAIAVPAFIGTYDHTNWVIPVKNKQGYWTVYAASDDAG
jgi:hypothetical protein